MMNIKANHFFFPLVGFVLFATTLWVLHQELAHLQLHEILAQTRSIPRHRVVTAVALTVLAYLVLTGYDLLAVRHVDRVLSPGKVVFTSFLSYVFSNNVGHSVVGAGAIRFRMYTAWSLSVKPGAGKAELSPDLMRHTSDAPHGVMKHLFIQTMLWGKQGRFEWFNLGMAPLSGLDDGPLAPVWTPKYLASPGGIALPRIMADLVALISKGNRATHA